jgi:hypothetical protein
LEFVAPTLLEDSSMTDPTHRPPRKTDRPVAVMPVTRLVSRPAVTVLNGQLVAVRQLVDRKAA